MKIKTVAACAQALAMALIGAASAPSIAANPIHLIK